ncbi:ArgE/DapE family deacylase [Thermomicrobiaceae bacterium CFH 74404]|uniref:Probable succinyl-diaminopimelate desuccinylase n=1 Tax=Thermalbibacter longus TaxID=2951981 RepID=A0AA41WDN4_9BACT|nr:ArgE/DapE family deacylase [Thermalbibacter longus]MCM8750112.1 ArgE/DapE family deacylase [Thermalbibacter longus]
MAGDIDPQLVRAIREAVEARREDLVALLLRLVGTPSVTGHEGPVQDVIEQEFRSRGLAVDRWEARPEEIAPYVEHVGEQARYEGRPNLVARWPGSGGGRSLLLNAHIDTVEVGDRSAWSHDPAGEVAGDLVYGRGSCDMKGGLVAFLGALEALRSLGVRPRGDLLLNTTVGEEDGGLGALSTVLRGYRADAVVISEPTRLALVPAQGGSLVFRLTVTGKAAHAAMRDEGVSAFEKFLPLYQDLMAFEAERNRRLRHPLYERIENKVPINIGIVRAGVWPSTVPETLVAEGRVGLAPGEDMASFKREVERRVAEAAERDEWLRQHPPRLEWFSGQFAPAEVPADAEICRAIVRAHEAAHGSAPSVEGVTYGADMRLFILFGGMPCVMYGPGDVAVAHQADEHISVTELVAAAQTFAVLIAGWCGLAED